PSRSYSKKDGAGTPIKLLLCFGTSNNVSSPVGGVRETARCSTLFGGEILFQHFQELGQKCRMCRPCRAANNVAVSDRLIHRQRHVDTSRAFNFGSAGRIRTDSFAFDNAGSRQNLSAVT